MEETQPKIKQKYVIVHDNLTDTVITKVNQLLNEGYILLGHPYRFLNGDKPCTYQAMILKDEN